MDLRKLIEIEDKKLANDKENSNLSNLMIFKKIIKQILISHTTNDIEQNGLSIKKSRSDNQLSLSPRVIYTDDLKVIFSFLPQLNFKF